MAKILVADDEAPIREMLKLILEKEGHHIHSAADGENAQKMLEGQSFDLLITDILMPKVDGIELTLSAKQVNNSMPVIAISGGRRSITADFNLNSADMIGVDEVLKKPFDRNQLLGAVNKVLSR